MELEYNPIEKFEKDVLPILKSSDDEAKKRLFENFIWILILTIYINLIDGRLEQIFIYSFIFRNF